MIQLQEEISKEKVKLGCPQHNESEIKADIKEENNILSQLKKSKSILYKKDSSYFILLKNQAAFCPYSNTMHEAKMKNCGLTVLAEGITKQPCIDLGTQLLVVKKQAEQ